MQKVVESKGISGVGGWLWMGIWILGFGVALGVGGVAEAQEDWSLRGGKSRARIVLQRFQAIVEKSPSRGFAFQQMVKAARKDPGLDRLIASYRAKAKAQPKLPAYRLILAHLLWTTGQKKLAAVEYRGVLEIDPNALQAHSALADIYQEERAYKEALESHQTVCRLSKDAATRRRCLRSQGTLYMLLKEPQKALEVWKAFLALSPQASAAREEIAKSLTTAHLYQEALVQWEEVLKRSGRGEAKARVFREIGTVYEQMGQWQKAVEVYRQAKGMTASGHWMRREIDERILQLHRENGQLAALIAAILQQTPKTGETWAMLARLFDETGRDKEAADAYKKALAAFPKDSKLRVKYITLLEIQNNAEEAIQQSRILVRSEPSEARYRMLLVELLSRMGKRKESLDEMGKLASAFSRNAEILLRLATLYRRRQMQREANDIYRKLIRLEPKEPSHRRTLGRFYFQQGDTKQALSIWQGLLKSGLPAEAAHVALAQIYTEHELYKEALASYKQAVRIKPKHLPTLMLLGESYPRVIAEILPSATFYSPSGSSPSEAPTAAAAKLLKEAIHTWDEILRRSTRLPDQKKAMHQVFALHQQQGTLYRLPTTYEERLRDNPNDIEALRFLAELELWKAQKARRTTLKAAGIFERILRIKNDDLDALLTLEQLANQQRDWHQAKRYLLQIIHAHKDGRRLYYRRMVNYNLKLGAYQDAILYGRRIIELNPEHASAHAELARIFLKVRDKTDDAIASYRTAVRLQPTNDSYKQALAGTLYTHAQRSEAGDIYRHILKTSKDSAAIYEAATRLMEIYSDKKDASTLENDLQTLAEQNPREISYFRALSELYRRQGRLKESRIAYLKAAATVDQKHQVYKTLADTAREQGDIPKAIIYFRKMLEEMPDPSPEQTIQLASMHFEIAQTLPAQKILIGLLQEHPNSPRILRQVARLLDKHNLHNDAIQAYELFLDLEPEETLIRLRLADLYLQSSQPEAAAGLFEEILWQERPRSARLTSSPKPSSSPSRSVPYYLRRRTYLRFRYSRNNPFEQALRKLLPLYQTLARLDEWERRLHVRLATLPRYQQASLILPIVALYQERRWIARLTPILETLLKNDPDNPTWLQQLAQAYHLQGQNEKSLALFQKLDSPSLRHNYDIFLTRFRLLLSLKDPQRLARLLHDFLSSPLNQPYRVLQVASEAEQARAFDAAELLYSWGIRYGSHSKDTFNQRLVQLFLRQNRSSQARSLLLSEWKNPSIQRFGNFYSIRTQRENLARLLWRVSSPPEQDELAKNADQRLTELLLDGDKIRLRYALADAYAITLLAKGEQDAQLYLPAIWGLSDPQQDSYLRTSIFSSLLSRQKYDHVLVLFRKSFQDAKSPAERLDSILHLLQLLRSSSPPPRSLTRTLEHYLRSLRSHPDGHLWNFAILHLAESYTLWGLPKRVIWWLESCRWLDLHPEPSLQVEYLKLLSHAYRSLPPPSPHPSASHPSTLLPSTPKPPPLHPQTQRLQARLFQTAFQHFQKNRFFFRDHFALFQVLGSDARIFRTSRYRFYRPTPLSRSSALVRFRASWMSRHQDPYLQASALLQTLLSFASSPEELASLEDFLRSSFLTAPNAAARDLDLALLLSVLRHRWKLDSSPSSRDRFLSFLLPLAEKQRVTHSTPLGWLFHALFEAKRPQDAISLCQRLALQSSNPQDKTSLLSLLAALHEQNQSPLLARHIYLQLASPPHKSPFAARSLAFFALREGNSADAERFYSLFLQTASSSHSHLASLRSNPPLHRADLLLRTAEFLAPLRNEPQLQRLLLQAWIEARQHTQLSSYYHRKFLERLVSLYDLLRFLPARLRELETELQQSPNNPSLLTFLLAIYDSLGRTDLQRQTLESLVRLFPSDSLFLSRLFALYRREQRWAAAESFLQSLSSSPHKHPLWHGFFLHHLGRHQDAEKLWKEEEDSCKTKPSPHLKIECSFSLALMYLDLGKETHAQSLLLHLFSSLDPYSELRAQRLHDVMQHLARSPNPSLAFRILHPLFLAAWKETKTHIPRDLFAILSYLLDIAPSVAPSAYPSLLSLLRSSASSASPLREYVSSLLLRHRLLPDAEILAWASWKEFRTSPSNSSKALLCQIWQTRGLHALCPALQPDLSLSSLLHTPSLAHSLLRQNHPFEAFLLLRLHWLQKPSSPSLLSSLISLAHRLGFHDDASSFLSFFLYLHPKHPDIPSLSSLLASPPPSLSSPLPSRLTSFPSFCSNLRISNRSLRPDSCPRSSSSRHLPLCSPRLLSFQNLLISGDCKGNLLALDSSSHLPLWTLSPFSPHRVVFRRESFRYSSPPPTYLGWSQSLHSVLFSRSRIDLKSLHSFQGQILAVFSESHLEWGDGWVTGLHHKLHLLRISPSTGKILSSTSHLGLTSGTHTLLHQDTLYLLGRSIHAFRASSGQLLWSSGALGLSSPYTIEPPSSLPLLLLSGRLIAASERFIAALDPSSGSLLWKRRLPHPIQTLAGDPSRLLLWTQNDDLLALSPSSGHDLWSLHLDGGSFLRERLLWPGFALKTAIRPLPLISGDTAFLPGADSFLSAVDLRLGKLLWRSFLGDISLHPPVLSSDRSTLTLLGQGGLLHSVASDSGKLQSRQRVFFPPPYTLRQSLSSPLLSSPSHWFAAFFLPSGDLSLLSLSKRSSPSPFLALASSLSSSKTSNTSKPSKTSKPSLPTTSHSLPTTSHPLPSLPPPSKPSSLSSDLSLSLQTLLLSLASGSPSSARSALLQLLQQKRSSPYQTSLWLSTWLDLGTDLSADLAFILPIVPNPVSLSYLPHTPLHLHHDLLAQQANYFLSIWPIRHQAHLPLTASLQSLLSYRSGSFGSSQNPFVRRFLHALLLDSSPNFRFLAALLLATLGSSQARHALALFPPKDESSALAPTPLSSLAPTSLATLRLPSPSYALARVSPPSLRSSFFDLLLTWDRDTYRGLLLPRDSSALLPMLDEPRLEDSVAVACFLAHLHLQNPDPSLPLPKIRDILYHGADLSNPDLAFRSSRYLALLGDRRGIHHLRSLLTRPGDSGLRTRIARFLLYSEADTSASSFAFSSKDPSSPSLLLPAFRLLHGFTFLYTLQPQDALASFQALSSYPSSLLFPAHRTLASYGQALALFKLQRFHDAKAILLPLPKDSSSPEIAALFGRTLAALGQDRDALPFLSLAASFPQDSKDFIDLHLQLAKSLASLGHKDKAYSSFQPLFSFVSNPHSVFLARATFSLESSPPNLPAALSDVQHALRLRNLHPHALALQARILHALQQTSAAKASLLSALREELPHTPDFQRFQRLFSSLFAP